MTKRTPVRPNPAVAAAYADKHGAPRENPPGNRGKLTDDEAREVRRAYGAGEATMAALAERFGVSRVAIWAIVHGVAHRRSAAEDGYV